MRWPTLTLCPAGVEKAPYFNVAQPSSESGFSQGILIDLPEGLVPIVGLRP